MNFFGNIHKLSTPKIASYQNVDNGKRTFKKGERK